MAVSSYGAGDEDLGRRAHPSKDLDHRPEGPRRLRRRGHRRLRPHAQVPAEEPRRAQARDAGGRGAPAQGRHPAGRRSTSATAGSTSPTSSSSATGSTSREVPEPAVHRHAQTRRRTAADRGTGGASSASQEHAQDPRQPASLLALIACGEDVQGREPRPGSSAPSPRVRPVPSSAWAPRVPLPRGSGPCVRPTTPVMAPTETRTDGMPATYTLTLEPGSYEVVAVTDGGPPTGQPVTIDVRSGPRSRRGPHGGHRHPLSRPTLAGVSAGARGLPFDAYAVLGVSPVRDLGRDPSRVSHARASVPPRRRP